VTLGCQMKTTKALWKCSSILNLVHVTPLTSPQHCREHQLASKLCQELRHKTQNCTPIS